MENIAQYTKTQLESIEYILKDSWEKNLSQQNTKTPNSMLSLIAVDKLCGIDTRKIRKVMEMARFDELYISILQNWKRELSNDRARPKYIQRRRKDIEHLMGERSDLRKMKRRLAKDIHYFSQQINSAGKDFPTCFQNI